MRVPAWAWAVWGIAGVLIEALAIASETRGDTLTEVLVVTLPVWAGLGMLAWLAWHFVPRFLRKERR